MEENFDKNKPADEIKSIFSSDAPQEQDPESFMMEEPSIDDLPQDIVNALPYEEPSLSEYSSSDDEIEEESVQEPQIEEPVQEQINEEPALYEQPNEQLPQNDDSMQQQEPWSEPFIANKNDAIKKYVIYIAKDFVPLIDDMDADARSAYVNDAIQLKLDLEGKDRKWHMLKRILRHVLVSIFTLVLAVPALFWFADKSFKATIQNYGYVQQNFEKLYKERADRERAIQRIHTMRLGL